MAFWAFVQCGWCGYTGCAAPIGDRCPNCQHVLDPDPVPAEASASPSD
jgi:hypothetical protein